MAENAISKGGASDFPSWLFFMGYIYKDALRVPAKNTDFVPKVASEMIAVLFPATGNG